MSDGRVRHLAVQRSARYVLIGDDDPLDRLWVVLHGYRQLATTFIRRFVPHAGGGLWIVAPEALNRFYLDPGPGRHGPDSRVGATWMTREDRTAEIADYVGYLDRLVDHLFDEAGVDGAVPVHLLGFSQGAHTAARWAVLGRHHLEQVVLWGSDLPADLDAERAAPRLSATDLVLVEGARDEYRSESLRREQEARLREWGVTPRRLEHPGGHELDQDLLAALVG